MFHGCRHEINAVVFLCSAETDAVSSCVQHDIPARWSEQVPDSFLQALPKVSGFCPLHCYAGQERHQLVQEAHPSLFPAGLGFIAMICLSLDISVVYYHTLLFTRLLKNSWNIHSMWGILYMRLERVPTLKGPVHFCVCNWASPKTLFYPRFSKFPFFSLAVINEKLPESFLAVTVRLLNCPKSLQSSIKLPRRLWLFL